MRRQGNSSSANTVSTVHDYNGTGRWSVVAVQTRYVEYCRTYQVATPVVPAPREHLDRGERWIYPIMQSVIEGIESGDQASIALGVEFIEEDAHFPFGKVLKSNTARALRRASLTQEQVDRVRERIAKLFLAGHIPHEFREYAKLLRQVGLGRWWPIIQREVRLEDPYVKRYYEYFSSIQAIKTSDS